MKNTEEKARVLVDRFINLFSHPSEEYLDTDEAKQCALIAVDNEYKGKLAEIEKFSEYLPIDIYSQAVIFTNKEWQQVKADIGRL